MQQLVRIALPEAVDLSNAEAICLDLCDSVADGTPIVIADMTATRFCDSSAFRMLLVAHDRAEDDGAELRIVVAPDGSVLRALETMGFERVLQVFTSLDAAEAVL